MKTFEELGLSNEFIEALLKLGIKTPTEIQEKAIPLVLAGRDIIGGSATGSGKTLVFASGIIENLKKNSKVQALIMTPTRELAEQVADSIRQFSKHQKLNVLPVYGGVSIETQIRKIQTTDIVVGTPGRILDHMRRNTLNLGNVKFLVLDEVDRMFDMGFKKDVETIVDRCPKKRQTMLFSATVSSGMDPLVQKYTQKPAEVSVESHVDPSKLKQIYYDVPDSLKFSLFVHLLKKEKSNLIMVFCATRRNADFVTNNLNNIGILAKAIHGGMVQNKRSKVMNEFNSNEGTNILVCTDVAARGLDIYGVSHVYNYDLPKTSEEYIHRIGRTARAGREGIAINILCSRDYENFNNIHRDENLNIEEVPLPKIERVEIIIESKNNFSRRGGGFNSSRSWNKTDNRNSSGRNWTPRERSQNYRQRDSRNFSGEKNRSRGSYGRSAPRNFERGRNNNLNRSQRPEIRNNNSFRRERTN